MNLVPALEYPLKPSAVFDQVRPGADVFRALTIEGGDFFPGTCLPERRFARRAERREPRWQEATVPMLLAYNAGGPEDTDGVATASPGE